MSVMTLPHFGTRSTGLVRAFTAATHRIFAVTPSDRPVRRDNPRRSRYLDDSLMSREMGRL